MKISYLDKEEYLLRIENQAGFVVILSKRGASVYALYLNDLPLTINYSDKEHFLNDRKAFFGKTVAPFCGRVKNGQYRLNGEIQQLEQNEYPNGHHSGTACLGFVDFDTKIVEETDQVQVIFSTKYHAFKGYPSDGEFTVAYLIKENEASLRCNLTMLNEHDAPIKFTNHTYYRLGKVDDILDHTLWINAHDVITLDDIGMVPTKKEKATPVLDFSIPKTIKKDIFDPSIYEKRFAGYDHYYAFDEVQTDKPQLELESDQVKMMLYTDFTGVTIYTYNYTFPGDLLDGVANAKHAAIAVEPQDAAADLSDLVQKGGIPFTRYFEVRFALK